MCALLEKEKVASKFYSIASFLCACSMPFRIYFVNVRKAGVIRIQIYLAIFSIQRFTFSATLLWMCSEAWLMILVRPRYWQTYETWLYNIQRWMSNVRQNQLWGYVDSRKYFLYLFTQTQRIPNYITTHITSIINQMHFIEFLSHVTTAAINKTKTTTHWLEIR